MVVNETRVSEDKLVSLGLKKIPQDKGDFLREFGMAARTHFLTLFLLFVDSVLLGYWVELFGFILYARILLVLVVVPSVVDVPFADPIRVTDRHEFDK